MLYLQVNMNANAGLPIREIATRLGVDTHVLRHWEDVGLLSPQRDSAGYRRYGELDVVRGAVIVRSKRAGMSLDQIRAMLDADVPGRKQVLERHLAELEERAKEVALFTEMTKHALRCEQHDITACPRFASMLSDVLDGSPGVWRDW